MSPRKSVEGWAIVYADGGLMGIAREKKLADFYAHDPESRVVHLTESDPSASTELKALRRVVRAAQAWVKAMWSQDSEVRTMAHDIALVRAVEALSKRKGRR